MGSYADYHGIKLPAANQVLSSIQFGWGGTEFAGNVVLPAVGDVQASVAFGASSSLVGTFAVPSQSDVRSGIQYGASGTEFTGTLSGGGGGTYTAAANVRFGTDRGDGVLGTLRVPFVNQVLQGVLVDASAGVVVLPSVGNVRKDVLYGGLPSVLGTLVLPSASQVQSGVGFGASGTEFVGTLAGGGGLTNEQSDAIALGVYRRLTSGSAVARVAGPTIGEPVDAINSADFDYSASVETASTSTLVFSIRKCADDPTPQLEADSASGLTILTGQATPTSSQAVITRVSATQATVLVKAAAFVSLAPGEYHSELRELTTDGKTISKLELPIVVRRSASRRSA